MLHVAALLICLAAEATMADIMLLLCCFLVTYSTRTCAQSTRIADNAVRMAIHAYIYASLPDNK